MAARPYCRRHAWMLRALAVGWLTLCLGSVALADEVADEAGASGLSLYGEVGVVSDYIDRGITSSNHDPALQGSLTVERPVGDGDTALYAGLWGSTVDFDEEGDGDVELGPFIGAYGLIGDTNVEWDISGTYYLYPDAESSLDYDYAEVIGQLGYALSDGLTTSVAYAFSPDYSGSTGMAHYVVAGAAYALPFDLPVPVTVDGTLGRQWFESNSRTWLEDYVDWSLGVTAEVGPVALGLRYTDTDLSDNDCYGGSNACDARLVLSATFSF
jgi:uncharacterized protein (TIGR02001 family)